MAMFSYFLLELIADVTQFFWAGFRPIAGRADLDNSEIQS